MTFTPEVIMTFLLLAATIGIWVIIALLREILEHLKFHPPKEEQEVKMPQMSSKKPNYMGEDGLYSYDNVDLKALQQRIKDIEEGR